MTREQGFPVSIMVASCISGEGKSVTALNLAMSLAQEIDHKVLLIDADIRNPSICRYLGLERLPGLVDCLEDGLDLEDAIVDTGLGNLCLLPAGRSCEHPVELLSSQKMKNFFNRIKREFSNNFIVIDISPVLPFAESRIMGDLVENILFVVKEGGCSLHNVMEAVEIMRNTNVLGIVFNKATAASLSGGYQYYYYDYASINRYAPPTGKKSWKERLTEFFNK
jgi:exopolysaccharide/PEP-CTERM locus tyrosine autokinase